MTRMLGNINQPSVYAYILSFGMLALIILYPYGNFAAVDAYFFDASVSTESGLDPVDIKALNIYQQIFLCITPIVMNLCFVNILAVRLGAAKKRPKSFRYRRRWAVAGASDTGNVEEGFIGDMVLDKEPAGPVERLNSETTRIRFALEPRRGDDERGSLYVPGPRGRDNGQPIAFLSDNEGEDNIRPVPKTESSRPVCRRNSDTVIMSRATSVDCAVSFIFVLRSTTNRISEEKQMRQEGIGGIGYRALRFLLKVTIGYYFDLHLFGAICFVPWIHTASPKALYSSQTMLNNLGLTLTPDSRVSFRDATWPMLLSPQASSLQGSLRFLLDHPRRCCTLLFPSTATWILFVILIALRFIDTLLIVALDLDNPESASSRHTVTVSFNLTDVNLAVQFSLLVMMYISVYPVAIIIRMSESYEERGVGLYDSDEKSVDERFNLWYVFLGVFCICIAENILVSSVFSVFFEVVSAYGNVGFSLVYPTNTTSLHRGLPYALDRAITLPSDQFVADGAEDRTGDEERMAKENADGKRSLEVQGRKMVKAFTR
ncbi:TrkH-domain-containing protein [Clathrospora elynae]|uniref:TrkH-domain-containing protein n=1 Tax=Clathrospora elynae TaxID=706981 RepID=A0A6A5S9E2_9PLEO|nr:TrkH-domain-containing protein [Clathrospora elynae]